MYTLLVKINEAMELCKQDNKVRYVYPLFARLSEEDHSFVYGHAISLKPPPRNLWHMVAEVSKDNVRTMPL